VHVHEDNAAGRPYGMDLRAPPGSRLIVRAPQRNRHAMLKPRILALVLLTAAACNFSVVGVEGSGVSASEDRQVAAFQAVALSGSFAVEVEVGPAQSVRVEADDNIVPIVVTEVVGEVLKISSRQNYSTRGPIKVRVTTPKLTAVEHSGSGSIEVRAIDAGLFTASLDGSGMVRLAGAADMLTANIDGSGSLEATDLATNSATVALSGSGGAKVHARQRVVATISGSGSVQHAGGAKDVVSNIRGSGSVTPM